MTEQNVYIQNEVNEPEQTGRQFSLLDSIFAWVCLIASYLFCRAFPVSNNSFGGCLLILGIFAATFTVFMVRGEKIGALPIIVAISAIVICFALVVTSNTFLGSYAYFYAILAYMYFVFSATANTTKKGFSDLIAVDFFKAIIIMPFVSFGVVFKALFSGRAKGSGKAILKILLGIAFAVIPTIIIFSLLSYDKDFTSLFKNIFDFKFLDVMSHFLSIGFAIPISMYVFGLYASSTEHKCKGVASEQGCRNFSNKIKIAPVITVLAAVIPILFIYVIFFISQSKYYLSGFVGVLPDELSYAEYAREGFFQLCTVSCLNLAITTAVSVFMKRAKGRRSLALKILAIVFSLSTLLLISTAIAKMVMYIDCYGLTQKRIYSTWLMGVLALIFIFIIIKQFAPKSRVIAFSLSVLVVLFGALSLCNIDRIIAGYNVDRYIDGSLNEFDIDASIELGDAAIPELVRLNDELKVKVDDGTANYSQKGTYYRLSRELRNIKELRADEEKEVFSYTIPYIQASKALENVK
ncbi:MAG: DUF4173 domain-containing protein [Acutalibacteraceae bacterium]|nr:DUF4173 domain-containing protein [Acutalibacteraceae bacterium]